MPKALFKKILGSLCLKAWNLAVAEQARRNLIAGTERAKVGKDSLVEFGKVSWKAKSELHVGEHSIIGGNCIFEREGGTISFGSRTYFASTISCAKQVTIGDDVLIASGGYIADHGSHDVNFSGRKHDVLDWRVGSKNWCSVEIDPVVIGDKAWIGVNVIILNGVSVGEGAVVGAGSVVTKNVAPYTVVAGNPARVIRHLDRKST